VASPESEIHAHPPYVIYILTHKALPTAGELHKSRSFLDLDKTMCWLAYLLAVSGGRAYLLAVSGGREHNREARKKGKERKINSPLSLINCILPALL